MAKKGTTSKMSETIKQLRQYQINAGNDILKSVFEKKGLTFTIEMARQGGKNELSSHLELILLTLHATETKNLIKCSPTFKPQTIVSMMRLKEKLNLAGYDGAYQTEMGYIIRFGYARAIFLSADEKSNVVGNTAHLLLEVDEAQDVNEEKYSKEFKPMGSTTNCTNVLYGTTWDDNSLLEKMKQINLEKERRDGIQRHFRYDWQEVAKYNPDYLAYVEAERARLGENHPLFLTQYRLLPVRGGGGFLNNLQKAQLQGDHGRSGHPATHKIYVAGIDLAGEAETDEEDFKKSMNPKQDSTVITIGELEFSNHFPGSNSQTTEHDQIQINQILPTVKIVEHYVWTGRQHSELYPTMVDLLHNVWHCRSIVVDATGIGQPVASFLRAAIGSRVVPFAFTTPAKSDLGFNLLAAINSGRLKMYTADNSAEYREFWHQMEKAKGYYRASRTMNFYAEAKDGHDDYLMSLALLVEAAKEYNPKSAHGK
jgi:hypothetical protein